MGAFVIKVLLVLVPIAAGLWLIFLGDQTVVPTVKIAKLELDNAPIGVVLLAFGIFALVFWKVKITEEIIRKGAEIIVKRSMSFFGPHN